jgi:hypothetical protein
MAFLTFRPDPDATCIGNEPESPPISFWAQALTAAVVVGGLFIVLNQEPPKGYVEITTIRG